ncbi:hypothetical protein KXJ69_00550 [Aureisphaera sp. CAU 1614]|uniref:Tetratricopeptide repeat protein n=1 Tax=Halomarinibacterium sedimenti TaxID=2857106 RepID=A0A9X1JXH3_9FLAO|nr:hypothetical protein [Halomarinibacterium sedimenti]MBW2936572.1 hypothetical protein [Halomarinibacterium sedimenti]
MTEADEILIEQYIQGAVATEEMEAFKQRLTKEVALAEAYENSLAAHAFIKEAGRMELKETLESFENKKNATKVRQLPKRRVSLVAASLLLCLGIYFMSDYFGSKSPEQVYESYFEMYAAPSTLRGDAAEETPYWDAAVAAYANGNYQEALSHFERAESTIPIDKVEFYKSLCHLQLEDRYLPTTLLTLKKISNGNSDYREQALWYYALGSLKNGNTQEALPTLERIVKNKGYRYLEASKILEIKLKN